MHKLVKSIISFSLKNKGFVIIATLITIIAGVIAYLNTPIEAFPDVTNTQIIRNCSKSFSEKNINTLDIFVWSVCFKSNF